MIFTPDWQSGSLFDLDLIDIRPGIAVLQVHGINADTIFKNESGGHRWQHAPTGRVHTSTITVAVLPEPTLQEFKLNPSELNIVAIRGGGKGGQNRNKVSTCVVVTHIPSNTVVRCETERSQGQNKEIAIRTIRARLWQDIQLQTHNTQCRVRNSQIGSGMRGDKRRTIQVQNNVVKDEDGRRWRYEDYRNGKWKI